MNRIRKENINTVAYWDGRYATGEHLWNPESITRRIASRLEPGWSVLDVGCGSAVIMQQVARLVPGLEISGCDLSPVAIDRLRSKRDLGFEFKRLFVHDIRDPLPGPAVDAVISTEMLEHLENPAAALMNMAGVAMRRVIVSVPRGECIISPEHLWGFTVTDLADMLRDVGNGSEPWIRKARRDLHLVASVDV